LAFYKVTWCIHKTRLFYYLGYNSQIISNLFGFWRHHGSMKFLSSLICFTYEVFCNRSFLSATVVDVQSAYDSVHISKLISRLYYLNIPAFFYYLSSLFHYLSFSSLLESECFRFTYRGFPQGNCLSPIIFNIW